MKWDTISHIKYIEEKNILVFITTHISNPLFPVYQGKNVFSQLLKDFKSYLCALD